MSIVEYSPLQVDVALGVAQTTALDAPARAAAAAAQADVDALEAVVAGLEASTGDPAGTAVAAVAAHVADADPHTQYQKESEKGQANGYASLDGGAKIPIAQLPDTVVGGLDYQGVWNASTNTPNIGGSSPSKGDYYKVSVAGATSLGGITDWGAGDYAVFNGATWDKIDNTDAIPTVFGRVGAIIANALDYVAFYAGITHSGQHQHGGSDEIAVATPAANAIPKATAGAKLDSWISDASSSVKGIMRLGAAGGAQAFSAILGIIGAISPAVDQLMYWTDATHVAMTSLTAAARNLLAKSGIVAGDLIVGTAPDTYGILAGNITATRKFLRELGTGTTANGPVWDTLALSDLTSLAVDPRYALAGSVWTILVQNGDVTDIVGTYKKIPGLQFSPVAAGVYLLVWYVPFLTAATTTGAQVGPWGPTNDVASAVSSRVPGGGSGEGLRNGDTLGPMLQTNAPPNASVAQGVAWARVDPLAPNDTLGVGMNTEIPTSLLTVFDGATLAYIKVR